MKTTYLKITASLLLLAGLNSSCDGCKDKRADGADGTNNVTVEATDGTGANDEAAAANSNDGTNRVGKAGTHGSGQGTGASGAAKGTKKGNGYSAADGTDAENHDGDMYTKNDTTPQASGPPIK